MSTSAPKATVPSGCNYKLLITFCLENAASSSDFFIIIIAQENKLLIFSLKRSCYSGFQVTYVCQTCQPLNELIFYNNSENVEVFLLLEKNNYDKSLIPQELISRMKIHEWYSFSNIYSSKSYQIDLNDGYRDRSYHKHSPPIFENIEICNFEAMIYSTLNSSKIFMGETIAILIPKNDKIYIYIFRRLLLHFLLESYFTVSADFEITAASLQYPQRIVKIVDKPFLIVKVATKSLKVKISEALIKKGLEFYEKAGSKKALAICGTPKYLEALDEAKTKLLLNSIYSSENVQQQLPQQITTTSSNNLKKTVIIEIKDNAMRVLVQSKINAAEKSETIFSYPKGEEYIPMCISFLRETAIIGNQAFEDYKIYPQFVAFDILNVAGKCLSNLPKINADWGFQLVPIDNSASAKFGFKIQTFNGTKVIPVEILLSILFKYLLNIVSENTDIKEFTLRFLQKKLSPAEKNVLWTVSQRLKLSMKLACVNHAL